MSWRGRGDGGPAFRATLRSARFRSVEFLQVYFTEMNTLHNSGVAHITKPRLAKSCDLNLVGNIHPEFGIAESGDLGFQPVNGCSVDLSFPVAGIILFAYFTRSDIRGTLTVDGGVHFGDMRFRKNYGRPAVHPQGKIIRRHRALAEKGFCSAQRKYIQFPVYNRGNHCMVGIAVMVL